MSKVKQGIVEVNSDQLDGRLARLEDRIAGVESLLAYVHREDIENLISQAIGSSVQKRQILRLCEKPQSISALKKALGLTGQALNHHLAPLRDHGLLQHATTSPSVTYEWTAMIRRLNRVVRDKLLGPEPPKNGLNADPETSQE